MRISRPLHLITVCSTLALFTACSSNRAQHQHDATYTSTTVEWDSGPLDRDYQHERAAMEARHRDEIDHARADESADQRQQRQDSEKRDLEDRYERGKKSHSNSLPPSNHQGDHGNDGYNQGHP
jgi:hypothetical protein